MRRRSRAGDKSPNAQAPKAAARKSGIAPKAGRSRGSSAASEETKVARLTRERDEALQQQRATAELLKVISRSTFDLQVVLETLVEFAAKLCEADKGVILRPSGNDASYYVAASYRQTGYAAYLKNVRFAPGRSSVVPRVLLESKSVQIPDVLADPEYTSRELASLGDFRTVLGVPLLCEGIPIGVLVLHRAAVRPFTEKQIELVETFADQAVIAIENTRLFEAEQERTRELRQRTTDLTEALEQQTATSEVLQVISSSPGDLEPVFATMLANAVRICDANFGNIYRWDGEALNIIASHDTPTAFAEQQRSTPFRPGPKNPLGRMVATKTVVHLPDVAASEAYTERDPVTVAGVEVAGIRTLLAVPMLKENELVGAFALSRQEVRPFTDKQIELVKNFAAQAVIAIENARLLNELRQRTYELTELLEQQTATSEVLRVISSSPADLQPVFEAMLESATRICEANFGAMFRLENGAVRMVTRLRVPERLSQFLQKHGDSFGPLHPWSRLIQSRRTLHIADYSNDRAYLERDPVAIAGVELGGLRTLLAVPMLKDDELVGFVTIFRQEVRPFTDKQIELVSNFANQAVIAIENARLLNELRELLQQQTATSDVLKVISRSKSAARLCEAEKATITRQKGAEFYRSESYGFSPEFMDYVKDMPVKPERGTAAGRALLEAKSIYIPDVQADPEYTFDAKRFDAYRTIIGVPMLREGVPIGVMTLTRSEVRPFTERQIELVSTFADQAVIAIENARLLSELRELLQQQTATADVLKVISRSAFDLKVVLDTLLRSAGRLCEADMGVIARRKDDIFYRAVAYGVPDNLREIVEDEPIELDRSSGSGRALLDAKIIQIQDIEADAEYTHPARGTGAFRTLLGVPMLRDGVPVGVLTLMRSSVRAFSDKQIDLVSTFADQAAIAIENVRLLDELRQRTTELGCRSVDELRALGEVSQAVNSTLDLETVLSTIVANAVQLSGTEAGAIYVYGDQRKFHLRATYGMDQELIDALTQQYIGLDDSNVVLALTQREPTQIADLKNQPPSAVNEIILRAGFRALLVAPLLRGREIVGLLVIRRRTPGAFMQNTVDLIKTFAAQSAVAIENARLFQDVETSLEHLRTAQDRLVQTQKLASLGQLTAGIAHEIKNPLNFVNNFSGVSAELIDELRETLDRVKADEKTRGEITELTNTLSDNLDKIVQHGKRADAIVKNMLLHSREGSGEHRLVDAPSSMRASISPITVPAPRSRASRLRWSGRLIPLRAKSMSFPRRSHGLS